MSDFRHTVHRPACGIGPIRTITEFGIGIGIGGRAGCGGTGEEPIDTGKRHAHLR